jgi:hypothetical protein
LCSNFVFRFSLPIRFFFIFFVFFFSLIKSTEIKEKDILLYANTVSRRS